MVNGQGTVIDFLHDAFFNDKPEFKVVSKALAYDHYCIRAAVILNQAGIGGEIKSAVIAILRANKGAQTLIVTKDQYEGYLALKTQGLAAKARMNLMKSLKNMGQQTAYYRLKNWRQEGKLSMYLRTRGFFPEVDPEVAVKTAYQKLGWHLPFSVPFERTSPQKIAKLRPQTVSQKLLNQRNLAQQPERRSTNQPILRLTSNEMQAYWTDADLAEAI